MPHQFILQLLDKFVHTFITTLRALTTEEDTSQTVKLTSQGSQMSELSKQKIVILVQKKGRSGTTKGVRSSIMFVKYFNDTDKLNHISYENNNANTTLKLDIERTMPLQKYNMTL